MKIKKIFKYVIGILLIYMAIYTCNRLIQQNNEKYFVALRDVEQTVEIMQNKLPIDYGNGVSLNQIEYLKKGNLIIYYYKAMVDVDDLTQRDIETSKKEKKQALLNMMKNNPQNKSFIEVGINFESVFLDRNDEEIYRFRINIDEYK